MKFKVGDKVRIVKDICGHAFPIGDERTISYIDKLYPHNYYYSSGESNNKGNYFRDDDAELLETNNKTMNIKESFVLMMKSEPEKTFRKTGLTNGDDILTEDGQKVFLAWLLKKFQDDFKKEVADELLKEQEK